MSMKTYNPAEVAVIVGEFAIEGFSDGSKVTIERSEDSWALQIGVDGEGTRSKSNNKSGTIKISLNQSSASNQVLSTLLNTDELNGGGLVPVMVKDSSGQSIYMAKQAFIVKFPSAEYGKEATTREWMLKTDVLIVNEGGN